MPARGGKVAESTIATATTTQQDTQITAATTNVSVAVFAQLFRYDCSIFVNVFFTLFFLLLESHNGGHLSSDWGLVVVGLLGPFFWGSLVTKFIVMLFLSDFHFFAHTHTNDAPRCGYVVALIALHAIYAIYTIYLCIRYIFI